MSLKFNGLMLNVVLAATVVPTPVAAQDDQPAAAPQIIFQPGTGETLPPQPAPFQPVRTATISCSDLPAAQERLDAIYGKLDISASSPEFAEAPRPAMFAPPQRLDRNLLQTALSSYRRHNCRSGLGSGPADIIVVDFAKPSSQPRLYAVNLLTGTGIDTPIAVAHGIGSDPDDDGIADRFSDVQDSLMSSLGAARGAELYYGQNGLSLRLDGLDRSNASMRRRDIVAHSYQPQRRRYFNASLLADRRGNPGTSEGCFVVAPEYRDWLYALLGNGGFLFAGLGGERATEMDTPLPRAPSTGEVIFVSGTGE